MTRTRRIIHHASWFTLLGPFIGMLLTIIGLMCITSDSAMRLLADILHMFSLFITLTWIIGAIPALLTGIIVANLPIGIYLCRWLRALAGSTIGGTIALLYEFMPHGLTVRSLFNHNFMWLVVVAGLFAGGILSWLAPALPGRGKQK
jgi:hypothetical protein